MKKFSEIANDILNEYKSGELSKDDVEDAVWEMATDITDGWHMPKSHTIPRNDVDAMVRSQALGGNEDKVIAVLKSKGYKVK